MLLTTISSNASSRASLGERARRPAAIGSPASLRRSTCEPRVHLEHELVEMDAALATDVEAARRTGPSASTCRARPRPTDRRRAAARARGPARATAMLPRFGRRLELRAASVGQALRGGRRLRRRSGLQFAGTARPVRRSGSSSYAHHGGRDAVTRSPAAASILRIVPEKLATFGRRPARPARAGTASARSRAAVRPAPRSARRSRRRR